MGENETDNQTPGAEQSNPAEQAALEVTETTEITEAVAVETVPEVVQTAEATTEQATPEITETTEITEAVAVETAPEVVEAAETTAETTEAKVPVETQPEIAADEDRGSGPFYGTGRRKTSVARVYIKQGSGQLRVNGRELNQFFSSDIWTHVAVEPLVFVGATDQFDADITVHGGGNSGQAGAIRMGLARALTEARPSLRSQLRKGGYLTRDSRRKERKKYGQKGARRRFQWTKR